MADHRSREQFVRAAGKPGQLCAGFLGAGGFAEQFSRMIEHLIRPDSQRIGMARANLQRLELGQLVGDVTRRRAFGQHGALDHFLVHTGGHCAKRNTSVLQHLRPDRTLCGPAQTGAVIKSP